MFEVRPEQTGFIFLLGKHAAFDFFGRSEQPFFFFLLYCFNFLHVQVSYSHFICRVWLLCFCVKHFVTLLFNYHH